MTQTELTTIAFALLALAALGVGAWLFLRWRRSRLTELQQMLSSVGHDLLNDFIVPDGNGGEIHIEYLLLTTGGLLLLETKDMQGTVFAGERMDTWSAMDSSQRLTFNNPIPHLQERAAAISLLAPGVPLESRVLFTHPVEFPKGHPAAVTTIPGLLKEYQSAMNPDYQAVFDIQWQALKQVATAV